MILIYSDSEIIDQQWIPNIKFSDTISICHDFEEYISSANETKIAFTTHRLHVDYGGNSTAYVGFEDKINQLSAVSKYVFTFESELHNFHWNIWNKCHHDNVYWVVPGYVNDREDINKNIIFWGDWFKTTSATYKELPHKLAELQPYNSKPKYFDALLGSPKPHRDFVAHGVKSNALEDKFVMTYGGAWNDDVFYAKDYFIYESGTEIVVQEPGTAGWCKYYGVLTSLSRIMPLQVYNETAYSIIAETDHDNTLSFFSEKTAKPFIARRLFVAFTGYKFLANLHRIGFKTFDGVIDESYDQILNDNERYSAAFDQVQLLCSQPIEPVLEKIRDVLEYNHNLIMTRDWTQYSADQITKVINEN